MGSHKTKKQLEIELNELRCSLSEKCSECDFLTKDNLAKSEAVANACADLKNKGKDLEDARAELKALKEGNKKLADQFYDYRTELVKVRKELADAIGNRDSFKVELEGVRGALKRESELRVDTEKKRDEYKQEMVKWKNEAGRYQIWWEGVCKDNELLKNFKGDIEKIMQKYCILTTDSLDNQLRHWKYTDNKLSHDLCMPLESLIQLLDEYDVNDFCKLRERLMYGPTTDYSNALLSIRKLEKRNVDLEGVADELEKQRRELEQKLAQERNVSMVQEARATDLERQLRCKTDDCSYWTDRAFRDEEELRKSMEHDRMAQENFEKAARRNDELQNEVNKLRQRWTDTFNPEDELLGRKVLEWQDINVVLAKYNIESADSLDMELEKLEGLDKVCKEHGIKLWFDLQKRLDEIEDLRRQSCPEEYMKVFSEYGIDSAETLRNRLNSLNRIKELFNTIRSSVPGFNNIVDLVNKLS